MDTLDKDRLMIESEKRRREALRQGDTSAIQYHAIVRELVSGGVPRTIRVDDELQKISETSDRCTRELRSAVNIFIQLEAYIKHGHKLEAILEEIRAFLSRNTEVV